MKRGTASRVVIGGNTMLDLPKGLVFGTDVILGGIAGLTSDFNGLVLSNTLMLGKKISHISVITVIVRGQSPLNLPYAIADSLHYVKAFGGTELLPKTYLDTVTLSGGCEQRNLPAEYTQVNYVTNTAQTIINTGVRFDFSKNYEIELKASGVTGPWYILQARESSGSPISGISGSSTGNVIGVNFNGTYVAASQISRVFGHIYYVKGTINNGNMTLYVKDETAGTEETVTGPYTPITGQSVDIGLFGNTGGNYVAINSDVYFARIKENDTVVMDYVPARQSATAGFYDKVSGTFKTASNLVADGNAVPTPDTPMDIVSNNGVLRTYPDIHNTATDTLGAYLNTNNAVIGNNGFGYTDYIAVVPDRAYDFGVRSASEKYILTYDENKNYLGYTNGPGTAFTYTPASGVAYIRCNFERSYQNFAIRQQGIYADSASKNLLNKNGTFIEFNSAADYIAIPVKNGTYTCSTNIPLSGPTDANAWFDNQNTTFSSGTNPVSSSAKRTVTTSNGYVYFAIRKSYKSGLLDGTYWVQVEQGSVATPYMPYWNTTETINVHGKNLFDKDNALLNTTVNENGLFETSNSSNCSNYIPVQYGKTYTRSNNGTPFGVRYHLYDSNKNWLGYVDATTTGLIVVNNSSAKYVAFAISKTVNLANVQLELGSTATPYEPYYDGGSLECPMLLSVGG